jgi:RimJ/RimL family protein N-acetyltransferase
MTSLVTARLTLRRARPADLAGLHAILSRPEAMRYWSTPEHETLAETETWLARMIAPPYPADDFVLEHQGRVIGKAGAWQVPEVGFILHPDFWGQGLVAEAMAAIIPHLFARHPVDRLTAEADPRNTASCRVLTQLGFRETHRAARTLLWRDEWCDSVYFALPRSGT